MTQRLQNWILRNTTGLQYLVNERLATRPGIIGRIFKAIEMGPREYSQHTLLRAFKVVNYMWVQSFLNMGTSRLIGSKFLTSLGNGPLNYSGLFCYLVCTMMVLARCRFENARDQYAFNDQDGANFWFDRYNMMFPPSFLHNRLSAHYIEINNIFFTEMLKRYIVARKDLLAERDHFSPEVQRTRYITNPNYIYEPFKNDTLVIKRLRSDGQF